MKLLVLISILFLNGSYLSAVIRGTETGAQCKLVNTKNQNTVYKGFCKIIHKIENGDKEYVILLGNENKYRFNETGLDSYEVETPDGISRHTGKLENIGNKKIFKWGKWKLKISEDEIDEEYMQKGKCKLVNIKSKNTVFDGKCRIGQKTTEDVTVYEIKLSNGDRYRFTELGFDSFTVETPGGTSRDSGKLKDKGEINVYKWGKWKLLTKIVE